MLNRIRSIFDNSAIPPIFSIVALSFISYHAMVNPWIDTSLLLSRVVFVFIVLATIQRLPLSWVFPLAMALGPVFDRALEYFEHPLMDVIRTFLGNVVNPQFVIITLVGILFAYVFFLFIWRRTLRFLFLITLLIANIGASSLFHYTQVDQFIVLEDQRMMKQANLLIGNLRSSGFKHIESICQLHGLSCIYGTSKTPIDGIDKDFYPMFKQAISATSPEYRTMRKFDEQQSDPTKASMYQIFMFSENEKWFYFSDQNIISPYYFNARRNFSILYSAFSMVWMLIAAYILYRHSSFIDKKFSFRKRT